MIRSLVYAFLIAATLVFAGMLPAKAEQSNKFGEHVVHYSAVRSDILTPSVAKSYSIIRRNNKVLININVHDNSGKPSKATVTGYAVNLSSQVKSLTFKEVPDGNAIYYLAQTQVSNGETLNFRIKVKPAQTNYTGLIKFKRIFYTD